MEASKSPARSDHRGNGIDGALLIQGNQVSHSGYPNEVPPGPESRRPINPNVPGYGRGIYAWSVQDVQILGNAVSYGRGPAISAVGGASHVIAWSSPLRASPTRRP